MESESFLNGPRPRLAARLAVQRIFDDEVPRQVICPSGLKDCVNEDGVSERKGFFKRRDLNGDGHPDLRVITVDRLPLTMMHRAGHLTEMHFTKTVTPYLWDWKTDTWKPGAPTEKEWTDSGSGR